MNVYEDKYLREKVNRIIARQKEGKIVIAAYKDGSCLPAREDLGQELTRDARYIGLATRIIAELGAAFVKTYYVDDFDTVTAACPVPVVIAGGKKLSELDALKMARNAIDAGAAGVDMGRNIFQSEAPIAMIQAVRAVVHDSMPAEQAYQYYLELKNS